ncbi:MAG: 3-hydroxyacyl-CoA dehydrogenase family protein [Firmicutes bacterium]|nr:3-hydroxyacyl-CoA dehydrogenase family protein [Bacillota bacterium]
MSKINNIAVIGAGTIGSSWSLNFAWKGKKVKLYDVFEEALERAKKQISKDISVLVSNGVMAPEMEAEIFANIEFSTDLAFVLDGAQFIQECGPEDYGAKHKIMDNLEEFADAEAIIATSTSGLLVTTIAENMKHPERVIGAHPYNPPHLLPLVEIVKGEKTKDQPVKDAYDFYEEIGKEPVVVNKEVSGFIANRIQVAVFREMIDLVKNGVCSLEDADKATLYGPGLRWGLMGPMLILHLGGGPGGIRSNMEKQVESYDLRLADMADWKHFPEDLADMAEEGMNVELSHRDPSMGRTLEELYQWRDEKLIEVLKIHKKL